jgi:hypothetical protein
MWRVFVALTRFCSNYRWTSTAIENIWVAGARLSHVVASSPHFRPHGPCGPLRIASFWWVYYVKSINPVGVFICVYTYVVHVYLAVDVRRTLPARATSGRDVPHKGVEERQRTTKGVSRQLDSLRQRKNADGMV